MPKSNVAAGLTAMFVRKRTRARISSAPLYRVCPSSVRLMFVAAVNTFAPRSAARSLVNPPRAVFHAAGPVPDTASTPAEHHRSHDDDNEAKTKNSFHRLVRSFLDA